jgi:UDP-3-O-[3-hydroxymyristoyl] glucosamine N-acyltransferase
MIYPLNKGISSQRLSNYLAAEHLGISVMVSSFGDSNTANAGCICFIDAVPREHNKDSIVISSRPLIDCSTNIIFSNLRLAFINILSYLQFNGYINQKYEGKIHSTASIASSAIVELGADIGAGVSIGPGSLVKSCVVLRAGTKIGANCTLGHDGFGFERDEYGKAFRFPHFGKLIIDEDCEIGQSCCISRGTLKDTVIKNGVKIDDHVYLAHNVFVKENSLLMAGVKLNGRVEVGKECWIGTNVLVREGCVIGNHATVGMGGVVVKNIEEYAVVFGNPAK